MTCVQTPLLYMELYQRLLQNGTNQIAAFLHSHGNARAQISCVVIQHRVLIERIGKRTPRNINCNVTSRKTANFCIPAEQLRVLQVTRPSPAGVRGWLRETSINVSKLSVIRLWLLVHFSYTLELQDGSGGVAVYEVLRKLYQSFTETTQQLQGV